MRNRYFISYSINEQELEKCDKEVLAAQIRVRAHWCDKELQINSIEKKPYSVNYRDALASRIRIFESRFGIDQPDIVWAKGILVHYEEALKHPQEFVYPLDCSTPPSITSEGLLELLKGRRSVRTFLPKVVPDTLLFNIISCALLAPTNCNQQSLGFVVTKNQQIITQLRSGSAFQGRVLPCCIAVVADMRMYSHIDVESPYHDSGAAIQNLMLAAYVCGLSTCYISASYVNSEINRKLLGIQTYQKVTALVAGGYSDKIPNAPSRRKVKEVIRFV